jgi:hypothetical protein
MKLTLNRRRVPAKFPDLGFTLLVPKEFLEPDLPQEQPDFSNPTVSYPLTLMSSTVAAAFVAVAARPAYDDGSMEDWARYLAGHFNLTIKGLVSGFVGGKRHNHPCIFVEAEQEQDGTPCTSRFVLLEDGKRLITAQALCPSELWPSYGAALEECVASIELETPKGPTVPCVPGAMVPIHDMPGVEIGAWPRGRGGIRIDLAALEPRREEAIAMARDLIGKDRCDDAELLLRNVDPYFQPAVPLARLYEDRLRELASAKRPDTSKCDAIFRRALQWSQSVYPDPHTEIEAEQFRAGADEARARLVQILGREPAPR